MSQNLCLTAVSSSTAFGKGGYRIATSAGVGLQTRTPDGVSLATHEGATPVLDTDFATKLYVDQIAQGLSWHQPARVCSTVDVTIAAPGANIDGEVMVVGDRFSALAQGTADENGLWVWNGAAVPATRPLDWDTGDDVSGGAFFVLEGTCADQAYVATADPAIVDTNDPLLIQFASVAAGVNSIALAGGATGASPIDNGSGPIATLRGFTGETGVLSAAIVGDDVEYSVDAAGITTAKIADDAVTNAKLAPLAAVSYIRGQILHTDTGSDVAIGTVPANSIVCFSSVNVTTAFSPNPVTVDLKVNAVSRQGVTESDLNTADEYACDNCTTDVGAAIATVGVAAGLVAGVADITFGYLRLS